MAYLVSYHLLWFFSLMFCILLPVASVAGPGRGGNRPPELPSDHPPAAPQPIEPGNPAINPGSYHTPFSEPGQDLSELAKKVEEFISSLISFYITSTTSVGSPSLSSAGPTTTVESASSITAPPIKPFTSGNNATLACQVFAAYTSLCPPADATPYTVDIGFRTYTVDAASASAYARASCLCYSAGYYVPDVYDDAAWGCAQYTTDASSADTTLMAAATAAAGVTAAQTLTNGFCWNIGNVRQGASYASFGQITASVTLTPTTSLTSLTTTERTAEAGATGVSGALLARIAAVVVVGALV